MKCPGQDMQYWKGEAIFDVDCPKCAQPVEFYKDDTTRKCGNCGNRFVNPRMDFGCAAYCQYAEQCIGTLPEEFVGSQDNLLKDKVAVQMKRFYKTNFSRISHVSRVARYAEKIGKQEGANLPVILCAAYLNDIAIDDVMQKYQSDDPALIKKESLDIAVSILSQLGAKEAVIKEVTSLIESHNSDATSISAESKILRDAERLALLEEQHKKSPLEAELLEENISENFLTDGGRQLVRETFEHMGVFS